MSCKIITFSGTLCDSLKPNIVWHKRQCKTLSTVCGGRKQLNRTNGRTTTHFLFTFFTSHIGKSKQEETLSHYSLSGLSKGSVGWSRSGVILLSGSG